MASSGTEALRLDEAGHTWDVLAERVDAFVRAWDEGAEPPALADFTPAGPPALRRLVLLELIKTDLDYRWSNRRAPRTVEDYLADFPELARDGPPCDLLYEEFHVRKRAGEAVDPADFLKRFPGQAAELGRLLGLGGRTASTSLTAGGRQPQEEVQADQRLDDFDLLVLLGSGAFARVFLARQRSMQRLVALKVSADAGDEPQTLAQLDHPHIVRVHDQRTLPDRGLRLLYMQYVAGGTLDAARDLVRATPEAERDGRVLLRAVDGALDERGEGPPLGSALRERLAAWSWAETVCWLGTRLADALDYAHRQGVLHRDVKPANVLLTAEGSPRLADFNVGFCSKLDGANPAAFFGGSLGYMSPEQMEACNPAHGRRAADLDGRSDLYSLCVVLWELLAGERPFRDEGLTTDWASALAVMTARRRAGVDAAEADRLPARRPPGLDRVLLAGLAPDPARRPETGAALARELELCLQPRAHSLLHPPPGRWRAAGRRFGLWALLLTALVPNALGALCNIAYNRSEIIARVPGAEPVFWNVQLAVNNIAFPVGLGLLALLFWPAARAVRRLDRGESLDPAVLAAARRRCLVLGDAAALVGIGAWVLAGPAYPIALCAILGPQPTAFYLHFIASLALCGLIAAVYPFFGVTFLAVRALYPVLLRPEPVSAEDLAGLERLQRRTGWYLWLSAAVPMLAVAAMAAIGSENRTALGVLSAVSLLGVGVAFILSRAIRGDLEALVRTAVPVFLPAESSSLGSSSRSRPKAPR